MKVAWIFPGQGSQAVGMGKELAGSSAEARSIYQAADQALSTHLGPGGLSRLCFEGPMEDLTKTANTQPAIVATSLAVVAALRSRFPELSPAAVAGHSLGEYSALVAAGALSLPDAIRVCRIRGEAMQHAVPLGKGAMAAIMGSDAATIAEWCEELAGSEVLSVANQNAPTQTVVAGDAAAVARLVQHAKGEGARAIPLKVSAPFHCALMAPAREAVAKALAGSDVKDATIDVWSNVDAVPRRDRNGVVGALVDQVDHTVRWVDCVLGMRDAGITHFVELGPGRVLAGLSRRIDKSLKVLSVNNLGSLEKLNEFVS